MDLMMKIWRLQRSEGVGTGEARCGQTPEESPTTAREGPLDEDKSNAPTRPHQRGSPTNPPSAKSDGSSKHRSEKNIQKSLGFLTTPKKIITSGSLMQLTHDAHDA